MKEVRNVILMVVLVFFLAVQAQADITIFESNTTISGGDVYDTVVIKGDDTVVDMTGGDVNTVMTMNASTFNMSGGNIHQNVFAYDSSVVNLLSGDVYRVRCYGQSTIDISGDASVGVVFGYNSSVVNTSSHTATVSLLNITDFCTLNVSAGSITGGVHCSYGGSNTVNVTGGTIENLTTGSSHDTKRINIFSGTINGLSLHSPALVRISGGNVGYIRFSTGDDFIAGDGPVEISTIGYNLSAVPYGGSYGNGQVSGRWNNDVYFVIDLEDPQTYSSVVLYDGVIPSDCVDRPDSDLNGDCMVNLPDFSRMASEWLYCGLDPEGDCW